METTKNIIVNIKTIVLLIFCGAFLVTYVIIPSIIGLANTKKLMDSPNNRNSHTSLTPTLGGVAFFFTLILSFFFFQSWDTNQASLSIIAGILILFMIGIKDDLVSISPLTKLIAQVIASIFVVSHPNITIASLNGFMGIENLSSLIAIPLCIFIMIMLINSFNLIDGIDGLAGIVGIIIISIYSLIFYYIKDYFFCFIGVTIIGSLIAFLRYNLSSKENKIFMGDTGSMIIGFVIGLLTIHFLGFNYRALNNFPIPAKHVPLIVLSILIVPIFDTMRVFSIRVLNKKNPFSADKNHIHHILLRFGFSHKKSALIIGFFNLIFVFVFIILSVTINIFYISLAMIVIIGLIVFLFYRYDIRFTGIKNKIFLRKFLSKRKKRN